MSDRHHPIFNPGMRSHVETGFDAAEVKLAHRNHGMPLEILRYDITPIGTHYLLTHFDVPFVPDPTNWRLRFDGLVSSEFDLTIDEINAMPQISRRVTLECAGNGRALIRPRWQSQPWHHEAIGTSEWTGTLLRPLLDRSGLRSGAKEIVFYGVDRGFDGGVEHSYGRSLSVLDPVLDEALLVTGMNGQPLLPQHGYPLRLIVPGWYGMASVKWLSRVEVIDCEFKGHQQTGTYIYKKEHGEKGVPVTTMRVRSLMVPPGIPDWYSRGRVVDAGPQKLFGRAWSGAGTPIAKVEIAVGGQWRSAELDVPSDKYAWRGWRAEWEAVPGEHELMCRATDSNGNVQPMLPPFDFGGFGNNAVQRVAVTVK